MGSIDRPFNPIAFALGCNCTFAARTVDIDAKHMAKTFAAAAAHKGTSFIEILQNCVIFNKDFYVDTVAKPVRADQTIDLVPGEKLIYGKDGDKGLRTKGWHVEACSAAEAEVWDPTTESAAPAFLMSQLDSDPHLPTPMGIFRAVDAPVYEEGVNAQIAQAIEKKGAGKIEDLVWAGERWDIG